MIKLDVKAYCHSCNYFVPEHAVNSVTGPRMLIGGKTKFDNSDYVIRCIYKTRCEEMEKHIREHIERSVTNEVQETV